MKYFVAMLLIFGLGSTQAQTTPKPQAYNEGLQYTVLDPAYDTENKKQVVVYEFFGYKCPHCASFQPYINPWHKKLPEYIKLVRVPVVFQPGWDILAKAYHTAETMGIAEKTHKAMFDAIHKKHIRFRSIEEIAEWYFENFGVDKDAFLSTANSFMIDSKMRQANNMLRTMHVTSTPTLIINGKYKPNVKALGSTSALLDMATFLADKEAKAMGLIQ